MIAVSGANGLVGAHYLIECIKNDVTVTALHRKGADKKYFDSLLAHYNINKEQAKLVQWEEVNFLDPLELRSKIKGHKTFVHCAGYICFDNKVRRKLIKSNRDLTEKIVNACLDEKLENFIYLSSIATLSYQERPQGKIESRFDSAYGLSKFLGELEVLRGKNEGLNCHTVKPGVILGPPPPKNEFRQLYGWIKKGYLYASSGSTGVVEVRDLAAYLFALSSGNETKEILAVTKNLSFKELIAALSEAIGINKPVKKLSKRLMLFASKMMRFFTYLSPSPQPLPKAAINAMYSGSNYETKAFEESYGKHSETKDLVGNMADYLGRYGKL